MLEYPDWVTSALLLLYHVVTPCLSCVGGHEECLAMLVHWAGPGPCSPLAHKGGRRRQGRYGEEGRPLAVVKGAEVEGPMAGVARVPPLSALAQHPQSVIEHWFVKGRCIRCSRSLNIPFVRLAMDRVWEEEPVGTPTEWFPDVDPSLFPCKQKCLFPIPCDFIVGQVNVIGVYSGDVWCSTSS